MVFIVVHSKNDNSSLKGASKLILIRSTSLQLSLTIIPTAHQMTDSPDEGSFQNMTSVPFFLPVFHQPFHLWYIIVLFYSSGNYLVSVKWKLIVSWLFCILIRLCRSNKIPAIRSWRTFAAGSDRQKELWWDTRAEPLSKSFLLCRKTKGAWRWVNVCQGSITVLSRNIIANPDIATLMKAYSLVEEIDKHTNYHKKGIKLILHV